MGRWGTSASFGRGKHREWWVAPSMVGSTVNAMCSGSEAGSYLRLMDFVYHSTLGLRAIHKRRFDCAKGRSVSDGFEFCG